MDWTIIISLFGIWGTLASVLLVYRTLQKMKAQRIASQKPDLIFPQSDVYGYAHNFGENRLLIGRLWCNNEEPNFNGEVWLECPEIKIYNVGFGVAKNIQLKWIFDCDKTIQQIKDYCYQKSVSLVLQMDENGLAIRESGIVTGYALSDHLEATKFDFLMPVSITKEGLTTSVPPLVKELISIMNYLMADQARQKIKSDLVAIDAPIMTLAVNYDDLEGNSYFKTLEIIFSTYYLRLNQEIPL